MTPFIVAEMSANHNGSLARAHAIVDAAADAGADGFKLQTWVAGTMCIDPSQSVKWQGEDRGMMALYDEAWTPWSWHAELFDHARQRGMVPFSASFDRESVDFLCSLGVERLKVASFELTDLPLIRYMASKGKPMILSTGMAATAEISAAVDASAPLLRKAIPKERSITLLRCTSAYPAEPADAGLGSMAFLRECMDANVGLSDHSLGIGVAVAAAALGATYIEKHLTLSRADGGLDAGFSMEPHEFKQMVTECRRAAAAIGVPSYGPGPHESTALRRSLWVAKDIAEGETLRLGDNVVAARPALGMHPDSMISGCRARRALQAGTPLKPEGVCR